MFIKIPCLLENGLTTPGVALALRRQASAMWSSLWKLVCWSGWWIWQVLTDEWLLLSFLQRKDHLVFCYGNVWIWKDLEIWVFQTCYNLPWLTQLLFFFFFSTGVTHVMIYISRIHTQITFVNLYSNLKYEMQKVLKWLCVHEITKIIYLWNQALEKQDVSKMMGL